MWFVCRWNLLYAFSAIICLVEKIHLQIFDSGTGRGRRREGEWVENVIQSDVHQNGYWPVQQNGKQQTISDQPNIYMEFMWNENKIVSRVLMGLVGMQCTTCECVSVCVSFSAEAANIYGNINVVSKS